MDAQRRKVFKAAGGLAVLRALAAVGIVIAPQAAFAARRRALFEAGSIEAAFAALGDARPVDTDKIRIHAPDVAENGALVPLKVASEMSGTEQIVILVEKNLNRVAASFMVPDGTLPELNTRVKMAEHSKIYAVVRAEGKLYQASRELRVIAGGCAA